MNEKYQSYLLEEEQFIEESNLKLNALDEKKAKVKLYKATS